MVGLLCNRRRLTYLTAGLSFFLVGVEYAVIIPTLNLYLESMDGGSYYLGICLSAMSITNMLSSPIYGRITDIMKTSKITVLLSNIFAIGGNLVYGIAGSPLVLVGSRFVVGLAAGSTASILGMISRGTTKDQRTTVLSQIFTGRQAGMIVGPAFNLFLEKCNFTVLDFHIGPYNSTGFFMACLWILESLLMIFFYHDLERVAENPNPNHQNGISDVASVNHQNGISDAASANHQNGISDAASGKTDGTNSHPLEIEKRVKKSFWAFVYSDLVTEESILFLFTVFVILFVQAGMEALITPLSQLLFDWGELNNSIYYSVTGVLYVISLASLTYLSKKVRDRYLIVFGLIFLTLNSLLFLLFIIYALPVGQPTTWMLAIFILYGIILALTMAFAYVPTISLFSKFTSEENQAFTQGIRLVFDNMGKILGPLWVSSLLKHHLVLLSSVNFALYALLLIMLFASFKQIVKRETLIERTSQDHEQNEATENTPLLSNTNPQA